MSWNNQINFPNWAGNPKTTIPDNLIVSSIQTNYISSFQINTSNLYACNAYINKCIIDTLNVKQLNSSNIANSNQITTNSLVATTTVSALSVSATNVSGTFGNFTTFTSQTMSNTGTFYNGGIATFDDNINVDGNANITGNLTSGGTVSGDILNGLYGNIYRELRVAPVFPVGPDIGTILSPSTITTDYLFVRSNISTNTLFLYTTPEADPSIAFTNANGDIGGGLGQDSGGNIGLASFLGNLSIVSLADTNIQSSSNMLVVVACNYATLCTGNIVTTSTENTIYTAPQFNINADTVAISSILTVGGTAFTTDIINSCNITTDTLTVNTLNFSNLNVINANVSGTLTVDGPSYLNGGAEIDGCTINSVLNMNGNVNFPYNTATNPAILPPNTQPLYDLSYIRNITCGSLYVQGGWSGDEILPPYHINTLVTIGNDGGITSPAEVVINGQNPGIPGQNITNALIVRGDMAVDFGILTTYNGLVCEPFNEEANALEVNGITALNGVANVAGLLTCEGNADIVGILDVTGVAQLTGGANVTGGFLQEGGNFQIGLEATAFNSVINIPLSVNTTTSFNGEVTVNDTLDMANNPIINVAGISGSNIVGSNAFFTNLSTNILTIYDINANNGIIFTDASNIYSAGITLDTNNDNQFSVASISSIFVRSTDGDASFGGKLGTLISSDESSISLSALQGGITAQADQAVLILSASDTISLQAYEAINLTSYDAGISLTGSNGVFIQDQYGSSLNVGIGSITGTTTNGSISFNSSNDLNLTASSNILFGNGILSNINSIYVSSNVNAPILNSVLLASCNALIQQSQINRLTVSTINTTGGNITVDANIQMDTSILYAGGVVSPAIYTSELFPTPAPAANLITVRSALFDLANNSITSVNTASMNVLNTNILSNLNPTIQVAVDMNYTYKNITNVNNITASNLTLIGVLTTSNIFASNVGASNNRVQNIWASTISTIHLQTSTINATNTITASTIATDTLLATAGGIYLNGNLYPKSAGAQFGFFGGGGTNSGGFFGQINVRSTITQSLTPDIVGTFSNNIKVAGHLSTMSLGVSTINFKAYPFVSTLNNAVITADASVAGTAILTRLQSNALRFPFPGTYKVFQEYSLTKSAGGANQGTHGSLIYASNGATTATVANATNWPGMGMSAVPFQDKTGFSTFTTAVASILVNSGNLTRDLYYYDSGSGTYTASFYINPPQISYIPSPGITPDI